MSKNDALAGSTLPASFATLRALGFFFVAYELFSPEGFLQGWKIVGLHLSFRVRHVRLYT